jgi:hypothetical protein
MIKPVNRVPVYVAVLRLEQVDWPRLFHCSERGSDMDTKKLVTGIAVGGITMFAVGYLIFDMAMAGFYEANGGAAFGVGRDATLWLPVALGIASLATLVTLCIGWSGAKNAAQGFKVGGMVGFLVWFGVDLIYHGNLTVSTNILPLVDGLLEIVRTGIGGAVIATVLGRDEEA